MKSFKYIVFLCGWVSVFLACEKSVTPHPPRTKGSVSETITDPPVHLPIKKNRTVAARKNQKADTTVSLEKYRIHN